MYTIKRANLPFLEFNNEVAPKIYQNIEENLRGKNPDLIRPFPWENPSFHWGTNAQNAIYIDKEITNFMGKCTYMKSFSPTVDSHTHLYYICVCNSLCWSPPKPELFSCGS